MVIEKNLTQMNGGKMKDKKGKGRLVLDPNAVPFTPELFAQTFFGMSTEELVNAMIENRGGEFDAIYKTDDYTIDRSAINANR